METRQARFRNMRSKCRCSCVLQFTRHHGVSSVLHRPPSQMIHCIVLCFGFSDLRPEVASPYKTERRAKQRLAAHPNRGEITNPGWGGSSLNRWEHPTTPTTREGKGYGTSAIAGHPGSDSWHEIRPSSRNVTSTGRQADTPRRNKPWGKSLPEGG